VPDPSPSGKMEHSELDGAERSELTIGVLDPE
jgi:hypothetical protein